ncbi:MAG: hypothetical protein ACI8P0_003280 [Planctomycetaceae bacterium]
MIGTKFESLATISTVSDSPASQGAGLFVCALRHVALGALRVSRTQHSGEFEADYPARPACRADLASGWDRPGVVIEILLADDWLLQELIP